MSSEIRSEQDAVEAAVAIDRFLKSTNRPILPTGDPSASNRPIHENASEIDRLEREASDIIDAARRILPMESKETYRQTVSRVTATNPRLAAISTRLNALITGGSSVAKSEGTRIAVA